MDALHWFQIVTAVIVGNVFSFWFASTLKRSERYPVDKQPIPVLIVLILVPAMVAMGAYLLKV